MSGHSKWSTIKHKKGAADAKRGKLFSKIIKEITVAARLGGGDPAANPRLRTVADKARAANMPNDNIDRAIKKGTGELEGTTYEEITFEGYGPNGVAVMIEALTDNRNRTVSEIRHIFSKGGGNLGENGCVAWMFAKKSIFTFNSSIGEEKLMDIVLESGADDIESEDDVLTVSAEPSNFNAIKDAYTAAGLEAIEANIVLVPENTVKLEGSDAEKTLKLLETLEDHDDVQSVSANFDIDTETMEKLI